MVWFKQQKIVSEIQKTISRQIVPFLQKKRVTICTHSKCMVFDRFFKIIFIAFLVHFLWKSGKFLTKKSPDEPSSFGNFKQKCPTIISNKSPTGQNWNYFCGSLLSPLMMVLTSFDLRYSTFDPNLFCQKTWSLTWLQFYSPLADQTGGKCLILAISVKSLKS